MPNQFVDLQNLTEPLTKLVEVVAKGIGTLYAPFGAVRQAKADATAKIIHATAEAEILSIQQRAYNRLEYVEARRQANLESIALLASDAMPSVVSGEAVDEDWILQFFESAQDVCEADMQKLWGRLLASEVASPKTFSKRTLQFLKTMDKDEAVAFEKVCSFAVSDDNGWPFIFGGDYTQSEMAKAFENANLLSHFENIGLVDIGLSKLSYLDNMNLSYFGQHYSIRVPPEQKERAIEYVYDHCGYTVTGYELRRIVDAKPIDGYFESVSKELEENLKLIITPIKAT